MGRWIFVVMLCFLIGLTPLRAEQNSYRSETGEQLSIIQTPDGKSWATLMISDQHTAGFAHNELMLLQLDDDTPVSLEHDNLSCGSPARAAQTVFYDFAASGNSVFATPEPALLPKGFQQKRQRDVFASIAADRRAETVDFVLSEETVSLTQLQTAKKIVFRFVTDDGQRRQAVFQIR